MASLEDPTITLEMERYNLGQKVLVANHAPLSQEFLKRGSPHSLRGKLWAQVLGSDVGEKVKHLYIGTIKSCWITSMKWQFFCEMFLVKIKR